MSLKRKADDINENHTPAKSQKVEVNSLDDDENEVNTVFVEFCKCTADVLVKGQDFEFRVHTLILAYSSEPIRAMLLQPANQDDKRLELPPGISSKVALQFFTILYANVLVDFSLPDNWKSFSLSEIDEFHKLCDFYLYEKGKTVFREYLNVRLPKAIDTFGCDLKTIIFSFIQHDIQVSEIYQFFRGLISLIYGNKEDKFFISNNTKGSLDASFWEKLLESGTFWSYELSKEEIKKILMHIQRYKEQFEGVFEEGVFEVPILLVVTLLRASAENFTISEWKQEFNGFPKPLLCNTTKDRFLETVKIIEERQSRYTIDRDYVGELCLFLT